MVSEVDMLAANAWSGRVAVIAGGSRGLGQGIAQSLLNAGATVWVSSRSGDFSHWDNAGHERVFCRQCDVSSAEDIDRWLSEVESLHEGIDALLVNTGGPPPGSFDDFSDQDWQGAFDALLMSAIRLLRRSKPALAARKGSALVITSAAALEPIDGLLLSSVMRAGVHALVNQLAREWAQSGVRINAIVPGLIATERVDGLAEQLASKAGVSVEAQKAAMSGAIPMGRLGSVGEFASAATFLMSPLASYINGSSLVVDGGSLKHNR